MWITEKIGLDYDNAINPKQYQMEDRRNQTPPALK